MSSNNKTIERKVFTKNRDALPLPDLIEVQKDAYKWFFDQGLKELFEEINPIKDFIGRDLELYFLDYFLDEPKFDERTAKDRNVTYEASLRVMTKLVNKRSGEIKEQEIYLGDFPLMTKRGTFIINGVERVVVSQLIRSPGVFFTGEIVRGRRLYGAKIIPNRGAWLEFETDANNVIWVRIDRKRKIAVTSLLRAFGYASDEEILNLFSSITRPNSASHQEGEETENKEKVFSGDDFITATIEKDLTKNKEEGLIEVYRRIRPGDLATADNAKQLIYAMFFNFNRYDFGRVGRYKINQRFGFDIENNKETRILRREDLTAVIKEIIRLNITQEEPDDIDHLGNRRVRANGELVQNKLRVGLARMERIIKDRMSTLDVTTITPNQLVNARPVIGVVREFFMSSQLSQFLDQTNPLAELEHKRRLSVMGPGGLSRERAGFEVRDVHRTHYGRICPIATPEGPNIGLVGHLSSYARLNEYGFLETPYRRVVKRVPNKSQNVQGKIARGDIKDQNDGIIVKSGERITAEQSKAISSQGRKDVPVKPFVSNEVIYLNAIQEEQYIITPATATLDEDGCFLSGTLEARIHSNPGFASPEEIDFIDVSPKQIVSVATSLIPFLEHDDAVRALMGTNMQRQAVACIKSEAPIVGTGVEGRAARDSGYIVIAEEDGEVVKVDGSEIIVQEKSNKKKSYQLAKFIRLNASTCLNQKPLVDKGDKVNIGDVLADGPCCDKGELALGQNILCAFMSWEGGNYEDAILISDNLVRSDSFSSIHIEDYSTDIRDTKLGAEVVTNDIPNVSEEKLKNLDEEGIIILGAEVRSGDILVGKITPKGETELSAEEKLLRAIFGDKAKDVRDSSLYLEHGEHGKVVGIKVFSREMGDKLPSGVIKTIQVSVARLRRVQAGDKMAGRHGNKGVISRIVPQEDMPHLPDGTPMDIVLSPLGVASRMNLGQILETHLGIAAKILGYRVASPVLDGVAEDVIKVELKKAGLPQDGKIQLYDGRTGEAFKERTTVGYIYMMKLNHLVEDKVHQRSIGPYSLITQQPLGGKAQFGGQRFGEMEVWALEGYGAAYTLQEILTIKSDDVAGRSRAYEAVIKGHPIERISLPESFNVLVRELKGLGLDVQLIKDGATGDSAKVRSRGRRS
ncbi:DNA-directed RNA polymerase subunit beta [Patescibacteria group bacterium]|nr:DNA-directed RNA polymerase subunit beta [Patescibacteria group bacterium]MBU4512731.1 DNA-directed RNA polymerase subunit beta [Patescibacteria group bacterium]MCG2693400.1 DNA-directed RNA polymerase subunit beta [Candidatus Parcubacteria bacterium]